MRVAIAACVLWASWSLIAAAPLPSSIGVATMTPDGTITLRLRAEDGGRIGEGNLTYKRGNPQYDAVLQHIGGLKPGAPADLILFDPDLPWRISTDDLRSKSKNAPFDGRPVQGRVRRTVVDGRTIFQMKDFTLGLK